MSAELERLERLAANDPGDEVATRRLIQEYQRLGRDHEAYMTWYASGLAADDAIRALALSLAGAQRAALDWLAEALEDEEFIACGRPDGSPPVLWDEDLEPYAGTLLEQLWTERRAAEDCRWPAAALLLGDEFDPPSLDDAALELAASVRTLTALDLSWCETLTAACAPALSAMAELRSLFVAGCGWFGDEALGALGCYDRLDWLDISGTAVGELGSLARARRLRRLNIARLSVTATGLAALGELPLIEALRLDGCALGDAAAGVLNAWKTLKVLELGGGGLGDAGVEALALPGLERLNLDGAAITDRALESLERFPDLRQLSLESCAGISDRGLEALARLPGLRELSLHGCEAITLSGLARLVESPMLERLCAPSDELWRRGQTQLAGRGIALSGDPRNHRYGGARFIR